MTETHAATSKLRLGEEVRYNGGHKHMPFLTTVLDNYMELMLRNHV